MKLTRPNLKHMDEALAASRGRKYFAYWMGPGTCKTAVTLQDGWRAYEAGEIDAVLVLAPNNVKDGWVKWPHMVEDPEDQDEVTLTLGAYLPRIIKGLWIGQATGKNKECWKDFEDQISRRHHKLVILSVNYEAMLGEQFFEFLKAFCAQFRTMIVADESTRIGKPGSKRTKRAIKLARLCAYRRTLSGTPIVKSPMKMYSQSKFLDDNAMPFNSFFAFRNFFAIMGGFQGKQILSYKRLDYLSDLIAKWSYRCRKEDCLDLPPQIFLPRRVYMTPEQTKAYNTMREEFYAQVGNDEITAPIVLTQIMRLQQIAGGYITNSDGTVLEIIPPARNPKLLEALDRVENAPGQVVCWARFRPEIEGMKQLLIAHNKAAIREGEAPIRFCEFHGGIPEKQRTVIKAAFKRGEYDVLLGTESTGGIGINQLLVADTVVHISSDFDTEKRIQADDRTHRMGSQMHEKIVYYDILVPNTVDVKIRRVLRTDTQLSARILREQWREWI